MTLGPEDLPAFVAAVWERVRPRVIERLALLQRAVEAQADGSLGEDLRGAAESEAHKLAGALGTYGFPEASAAARDVESTLAGPDRDGLAAAVARLRSHLPV